MAREFHPKTLGLKEFLDTNHFLDEDKNIVASMDSVRSALEKEFPDGFIVKANAGVNTAGQGNEFYVDIEKFLTDLMKLDSQLYRPANWSSFQEVIEGAYALPIYENFIIQDQLSGGKFDYEQKRSMDFAEVRVHSYQGDVIQNATATRWDSGQKVAASDLLRVEEFIGRFLSLLPENMLARQAWCYDVALTEDGRMGIIELNTNRGSHNNHWSSFLRRPIELTAHARHLEKFYGIRFQGLYGFFYRNYLANYLPWWRKNVRRAPDKHTKLLRKWIPPWPFPW